MGTIASIATIGKALAWFYATKIMLTKLCFQHNSDSIIEILAVKRSLKAVFGVVDF